MAGGRRVAVSLAILGLAGLVSVASPTVSRRVDADPVRVGRAVSEPDREDSWWGGDGRLRQLYRPRFVPAGELIESARSMLPPAVDLTLDSLRRRLLFTGTRAGVDIATQAVDFLDVPTPSALIEVMIVETARRKRNERGGHGLFDRDGPPAGPDTFFRSLRFDFEPESWLRSELTGTDSFQGTSVHGGQSGTGGPLAGTIDVVLRGLSHEGEAEILSHPSIVVTEGVPAFVTSTIELPVSIFRRSDVVTTYGPLSEHTGVRFEVTAVKIGADRLVLRLHPWVRQLTQAQSPNGPAGYPVLSVRELTTTVTVADGQEFLLGGVASWQRVGSVAGLPMPPALAALTSALGSRRDDLECVDLLFRLRARILHPGRDDARVVPPGEDARLRRGELAGRIPRPEGR